MKLKKIASLMLAGIMAVSMLAACGEGKGNDNGAGSSSSEQTSSGYAASILNDTAVAKYYATAGNSTSVEKAVNAISRTDLGSFDWSKTDSLYDVNNNGSAEDKFIVAIADDYMKPALYDMGLADVTTATNPARLDDAKDKTVYALFFAGKDVTDERIDALVANELDAVAEKLVDAKVDMDHYEFTVNAAKADWLKGNDADKAKDGVIICVAITVDYTAPSFN